MKNKRTKKTSDEILIGGSPCRVEPPSVPRCYSGSVTIDSKDKSEKKDKKNRNQSNGKSSS